MTQTLAEPTTPSTPSTASDSPQERGSGGGGGWIGRLFGSGETRSAPSTTTDAPVSESDESAGDEGASGGTQPTQAAASGTPKPADEWKAPASREEHERAVQAEVDRRETKRKGDEDRQLREQATRVQNDRLAELERAEEEAVNDGDLDQVRAIKGERRQILASVRQGQFVSGLIGSFDTHMLVPLLAPLPQAEQEQIVEAIQPLPPLEGRAHAVKETLTRLEKTWRADEAKKTRARLKTDEVFLREVRASMRDDEEEAEHVPGTPSANGSGDVNSNANAALASLIRSRRG